MLIEILLLVVGLVILTFGADKFVEGASSFAKGFGISELAIGLTIVAFGTSAPELIVNVFAAVGGNNGIAYGNIIGSNSFNLLLILGIAGLIYPLVAHKSIVVKDAPLSLFAAILVFVLVNDQMLWGTETIQKNAQGVDVAYGGIMSRLDAGILLVFFAYFLYSVFKATPDTPSEEEEIKVLSTPMSLLFMVGGLVGLVLGGKLIVDSAVSLATAWGMSEKMIGLTIVSAGTSLPELATSAIAAYKKKSDIAIANVIGSNIFNIFFILGASAMITPIPYETAMNFDIYVLLGATVLFWLFVYTHKVKGKASDATVLDDNQKEAVVDFTFNRLHAFIFLSGYIAYTIFLIMRG
jgi:cation:H+ antiporter